MKKRLRVIKADSILTDKGYLPVRTEFDTTDPDHYLSRGWAEEVQPAKPKKKAKSKSEKGKKEK
ncbi:MAG TPA: hypothetical protein VLV83_26970 [Acidobacteriota bacterium]|nr:hypothetical protein [Acidobacteriota bacterium]